MNYFRILLFLSILACFSFFFKITKWYGNNKFEPKYHFNPNQLPIQPPQCQIQMNPLYHNPSYHS